MRGETGAMNSALALSTAHLCHLEVLGCACDRVTLFMELTCHAGRWRCVLKQDTMVSGDLQNCRVLA